MRRFFIRHAAGSPARANTRIAFYIPTLAGGGAERMILRLATVFAERGHAVDLVLNRYKGSYVKDVPSSIRVVELTRANTLTARLSLVRACPQNVWLLARSILLTKKPIKSIAKLPALADYVQHEHPAVLISGLWYANLLALWATAPPSVQTRVIVTERNHFSSSVNEDRSLIWRICCRDAFKQLVCRTYGQAAAVVTVSRGIADNLAETTGLARPRIQTIYNPVVSPVLFDAMREATDHPWLARKTTPVILAVGRLHPQKNFDVLLSAFASVRAKRQARLVILGEGPQRKHLESQIESAHLGADIDLPGWVDNPYAFMYRADLFVLSSRYEGLGNVLIEALACGCRVVATDCPHGPGEVLADGRYGPLVPVGDVDRLAEALQAGLDDPGDAADRMGRANDFSVTKAVDRYEALVQSLLDRPPGQQELPAT